MPRGKKATGRWLMLENFERKRDQLVEAGVPFMELKIEKPWTVTGIVFPEEEKDKVFQILGIGEKLTEFETEKDGVVFLEVYQLPEQEREMSKSAYIKECGRRLGTIREETRKGIREAENGLENASRQIVELTRRLEGLRMKQAQLEESNRAMDEKFGEEFEKLLQVPHISKVLVANGIVSVFTDTIFIEYDEKIWELGDYRIDVYTNGSLKIVNLRIHELTDSDRFHHPHIFERDGSNVCLGNIREGVYRLIGAYEYAVAAQILIEFLHTMKKSSEYISYLQSHWKPQPLKKKKEE